MPKGEIKQILETELHVPMAKMQLKGWKSGDVSDSVSNPVLPRAFFKRGPNPGTKGGTGTSPEVRSRWQTEAHTFVNVFKLFVLFAFSSQFPNTQFANAQWFEKFVF